MKYVDQIFPAYTCSYLALQLQHGANSARSDDVNHIKAEVCSRVNNQYKPDVLLQKGDRSNRGIQHDVCGKLLCPVTYNWDEPECVFFVI